jgi:hypothetical protein
MQAGASKEPDQLGVEVQVPDVRPPVAVVRTVAVEVAVRYAVREGKRVLRPVERRTGAQQARVEQDAVSGPEPEP